MTLLKELLPLLLEIGLGQIIIQKQRRQYKYAKAIISLDSQTNISVDSYLSNNHTSISELEDYLDEEYFGVDSDLSFTKEDIIEHRKFLEGIYNNVDIDVLN